MAITINPRSPHDQLLYPYECFTKLRTSEPIIYNSSTKIWEVFSYEDVLRVATDYELFSSDSTKFPEIPAQDELLKTMLSTDPPRHRQLRSLVSQAFTPRSLAQLEPRIRQVANDLLDMVANHATMDIIDDFSYPLPVIVISEMLGIPASDRAMFRRWSNELVVGEYADFQREDAESFYRQSRARVRKTIDAINDYLRVIVNQRRHHPEHDLISDLLAARIEGEALAEDELLGFCALLLVAGNITTTNLIGNAILCFDEHVGVYRQLQQQPELLPGAIEEVLRYRSPALAVGRIVAQDMELHGQSLSRGQYIVGWLATANYDPDQFPHPETFDIMRNPNRHIAFGHGIHFCLGAPLARLEAKVALEVMLARLHDVRRDRAQDIVPVQSSFIFGVKHLPITFSLSK